MLSAIARPCPKERGDGLPKNHDGKRLLSPKKTAAFLDLSVIDLDPNVRVPCFKPAQQLKTVLPVCSAAAAAAYTDGA